MFGQGYALFVLSRRFYSAVAWFLDKYNPISTLDNKTSNQVTGDINTKREKQTERANKYNELINNIQLYDCKTK